jgi:hypothetical protein
VATCVVYQDTLYFNEKEHHIPSISCGQPCLKRAGGTVPVNLHKRLLYACLTLSTVRYRSPRKASFIFGYRPKPHHLMTGEREICPRASYCHHVARSFMSCSANGGAPVIICRRFCRTIGGKHSAVLGAECAALWDHTMEGNNVDIITLSIILALVSSWRIFFGGREPGRLHLFDCRFSSCFRNLV